MKTPRARRPPAAAARSRCRAEGQRLHRRARREGEHRPRGRLRRDSPAAGRARHGAGPRSGAASRGHRRRRQTATARRPPPPRRPQRRPVRRRNARPARRSSCRCNGSGGSKGSRLTCGRCRCRPGSVTRSTIARLATTRDSCAPRRSLHPRYRSTAECPCLPHWRVPVLGRACSCAPNLRARATSFPRE